VRSVERRTASRSGTDRRKVKTRPRPRTPRGESQEVRVTVSIGVAEPRSQYAKVDQVLLAADKALYRAKDAGRNRVEVFGALRAAERAMAQTKSLAGTPTT